jgi:hypothetical protein
VLEYSVHMALEHTQVVEQTKLLLRLVGSQTNLDYNGEDGKGVAAMLLLFLF